MDNITIVQNFSLPGEVCRKFALDWSLDNKISLCTNKAVYIFSSYSSPFETGFPSPLHKQAIRAPAKIMEFKPVKIPPNAEESISSLEDEENIYKILLDHTLQPCDPILEKNFQGYRYAKWSPKGAARNGRCLLATLTMDHRLALYEERGEDWKCICDLSEKLKSIQKENNSQSLKRKSLQKENNSQLLKRKRIKNPKKHRYQTRHNKESSISNKDIYLTDESNTSEENNQPATLNYEDLCSEIYKLAAMEIMWTGMFGSPATSLNDPSSEYCYLVVAMKSGHVIFWKVSPNESNMFSLAFEWDTGLGLLSSIYWQQTSTTAGFLLCGSVKGILAFVPVSVQISDNQEPKLCVKEMCKVWDEEDNVVVDQITVLKVALKKYVIVAAKLHFLVGCEIALTDSSIIIRNVGHSYGLHKLPITGMCVADPAMPQYRVLISTLEGLIIEIKVSLGNNEIKFQHEKLEIDMDLKNLKTEGLVVSSNGLLCSLLLSTGVYYDHLAKKEPLQFIMFVTKPFDEIYSKLKSLLKPQFSFMPIINTNMIKYSDFFECIRINLATGTSLPEWMINFMNKDPNTYETLSQLELYFMRFLLTCYVSGVAIEAPEDKEILEVKLYSIDSLIVKNYISKVFGSCNEKIDLLTPAQGQSLLLMADYLYKEFHMPVETLYTALGFETPIDSSSIPPRETCRICKSEVKLDNIKTGQCVKNHIFARCCQSFLLCDVIPYYICFACKSMALQDVWNFGNICTYCGMPMILKVID